MSESPTIVNNYSVDLKQLMNEIALQEQNRILALLQEAKILRPSDDGNGLVGVVYVNWEDRNSENHNAELTLITIGAQPQPEPGVTEDAQ
jgi:hypothetical protein